MNKKKTLSELKRRIIEFETNAKVWLYGSRANDTARADSDWDILVIVD